MTYDLVILCFERDECIHAKRSASIDVNKQRTSTSTQHPPYQVTLLLLKVRRPKSTAPVALIVPYVEAPHLLKDRIHITYTFICGFAIP
jgi:hypothetical protein